MAALTCKATVRFKVFTPALMHMLVSLYAIARDITAVPEIVITSVNDSQHMAGSRHYSNEAIDLRVKNLPNEAARQQLISELKAELGPAFTVLYEHAGTPQAHIHLQPKRGTVYSEGAA